ncbi:unnamed protein product [Prorocentrum cordatum]|uniref:Uncharacterized protein n=1 Tax=Prorocentrum cordatum TaxID=2364126 RepID=A0ABN9UST5_9DINO|nr:unnamed protein product [Polarella glacialis]|mmetsp:Transcript_93230/g.260468  ORF Transcript_93230/g.260468 Transcript_93230/m.260468 type:complete len:118 (+) Transcript_93230:83-436(+)
MPVDLTIAGAMGLKAVAAAKAASAAAKQAAAQAIAMAQNTNMAALQAEQAQANLEKYVYGVPVSSVPPSVMPQPPAALHPFPVKAMSAQALVPLAAAAPRAPAPARRSGRRRHVSFL